MSSYPQFQGWQYPPSGPVPPSPVVVNTIPNYFGGRPTPPASPTRFNVITVDDYAPCPPTPHCVFSDGELANSEDPASWTSSGSHGDQNIPSVNSPISDEPSSSPANVPVADPGDQRAMYQRICSESFAYPSPVLIMIQRANLDQYGLQNSPVNPSLNDKPLKLCSLFDGHILRAGVDSQDQQSTKYYAKVPVYTCPFRNPERVGSYKYTISSIEDVQRELRSEWFMVYPSPIPVLIIRSSDIAGPTDLTSLRRRMDAFAFLFPTEDSIWPIVRQRGIDKFYRPLDPFTKVDTGFCVKGDAAYWPQHIVASKFAVNIFVQYPNTSSCEYLGAYVMQVMDNTTLHKNVWTSMDPKVQQAVRHRFPRILQGRPFLPYVQFLYYKWDAQVVALADENGFREFMKMVHSCDNGLTDGAEDMNNTNGTDSGLETGRGFAS